MSTLANEGDVTGYKLPEIIADLAKKGFDADAVAYKRTITVQQGRKKRSIEADAVMFAEKARLTPLVVIETKPPEPFKKDDAAQAISYARLLDTIAPFAILSNGLETRAYDVLTKRQVALTEVTLANAKARLKQVNGAKLAAEAKHEIFRVDSVQEYKRILRACHNTIRNNEGYDPTKAFDELSKVMFCKLYEEKHHSDRFHTRKFDEMSAVGVNIVQTIFDQTKDDADFKPLFDPDATIELSDRTIRRLVEEFQDYDLSLTEFDVKGEAFEHFLGDTFTGGLGQYFTPRNVVNFMVEASAPKIGEKVVDPFCGTGGFLIAWHKWVSTLIEGLPVADSEKEDRLDHLDADCIFGVDWNERTAQACRMNLSMHGDGDASDNVFKQSGFVDAVIKSTKRGREQQDLRVGEALFDKVLTNPPFGATESDPDILLAHDLGKGRNSIERAALAMERVIRLAKPGGLVSIVIMDGVLANPSMKFVRDWVRCNTIVKALISLNPETFEGYGGRANTSILFLEKRTQPLALPPEDGEDVFMAMCLNSGYAPNGREIEGNDLVDILSAYQEWQAGSEFTCSLAWTETLRERLDPRHYWRPEGAVSTPEMLTDKLTTKAAQLLALADELKSMLHELQQMGTLAADEFSETRLSDLLAEVSWKKAKVRLEDSTLYSEVGVRWWGGGAFVRAQRLGKDIKATYMLPVQEDALIYNRMFAFRASFAVTDAAVSGGFVSNEFPQFKIKPTQYDERNLLRYIVNVLNSPASIGLIDAESQGSTKTSRNRLNQKVLLSFKLPVPKSPEVLDRLVALLERADALRDAMKTLGDEAQELRDGFSGLIPSAQLNP